MGLMKELGIRAMGGNQAAITAARNNERLLKEQAAGRRELQKFSWAVPCSAELAEAGITGRVEPELDEHDPELEAWLEREYGNEPAPLDEEVPF